MRAFIKVLLVKITVLLKIEYDQIRIEYGEVLNACEISNGDDATSDVWNEYNHHKCSDRNIVIFKTI